ncbi:STAS domain-containing protein [Herpetosiphon llansteffanensis]|uniref:STAS domain-containing protein n=1 Tax=Herpetosiphon llansteffanensis TaxID=2094568 RepID=UPI000D7D1FA3|nr:STAS domain-containing protein [Herpetosiphon llansteffanensis]
MRARVRQRVTLIVLLAALLPLLAVWAIALTISYRAQQNSAQNQQIALTNLAAEDYRRFILNSMDELRNASNTIGNNGNPSQLSDLQLGSQVLFGSSFSEVGLYRVTGERIAVAARLRGVHMPESLAGSPLLQMLQNRQVAIQNPEPLQAVSLPLAPSEVPRFRMALPVLGRANGELILVADISMDRIWETTSRIESAAQMRVLVVNQQGQLISAANTQSLIEHQDLTNLPLLTNGNTIETYDSPFGEEVLGVRTALDPTDWMLIVERPLDVIYSNVRTLALSLSIVIGIALPLVAGIGWYVGRRIALPVQELYASVTRFTNDPNAYTPVHLKTRDELASLGDAFNTMVVGLNASQSKLSKMNEELEGLVVTRTGELHHALAEVQAQNVEQERLLETVRRLSMPTIPITKQILVMPLVGEFSANRAGDINATLLKAIEQQQAKVVIMDITGVPVVDAAVARALINASHAAQLLGARVILAGIRPDMAETLVNLHLDLAVIDTAATLAQAFSRASDYLQTRRRA